MDDGDTAALHALTDEACHHIAWHGVIRTRSESIKDLSDGRIAFDLFVVVDNRITLSGTSAFAAGTYFNVMREDGRKPAPKYLRHLRIYQPHRGRLVARRPLGDGGSAAFIAAVSDLFRITVGRESG